MTFEELQELVAEQFSCDEDELTVETELAELGADHEDFIELAWGIGEAIGVEIDEKELERCETLGDIYKLACELEEDQ